MIKNYVKDLTDEALKDLYDAKRYCLIGVYNTCKELGNKDPENNVIVKGYLEQIKELEQELKERGIFFDYD